MRNKKILKDLKNAISEMKSDKEDKRIEKEIKKGWARWTKKYSKDYYDKLWQK